jgi:hypothetical protein
VVVQGALCFVTETDGKRLVLCGTQNRTPGPYLAVVQWILVPLMLVACPPPPGGGGRGWRPLLK